ncbi:hypothetical protein [Flavobacterium hibisci]|uniref:hypothetical protein n=1 Tax=Flavobacterium hibisci TaxID=1914462 RepID=UPI001CC1AAC1|nr:hypothetical protein [Flavobacterium hibisci]MBZ4041172.1 hypothetical protein [Flavobacterium hibisci]
MYANCIKKIILLIIIPISINGNSQSLKTLKDSVFIDNTYFTLQELKIISKNKETTNKIYKIIQNTYPIFDKPSVLIPEQRIKEKKDMISKYILENILRESNVGFEDYKIYYDKNNIINISIGIQSYGSPWEGIKYYCFDLNTGKRIGLDLFLKQDKLVKEIRNKLKNQGAKIYVKRNDLLNFKILIDKSKHVKGIDFSIFDTENHRNGGYEEFIVHFNGNEIKEYFSPLYKNRFLN